MEEWKEYKLGDVCKSIADGDHMPPPKVERGIPFVCPTHSLCHKSIMMLLTPKRNHK